jgi:glycopeptide antibiotics resistance protein
MRASTSLAVPTYIMHVILPLLVCGYIYAFCRPDGMGLQVVLSWVVGADQLQSAKAVYNLSAYVDTWVTYSMPAMLWTFSIALLAILFDIDKRRRHYLVAFLPLALTWGLEALQYVGLTDGTFDVGDIIAGLLGYLAAILYIRSHHLVVINLSDLKVRRLLFACLFACVSVGDVWVA